MTRFATRACTPSPVLERMFPGSVILTEAKHLNCTPSTMNPLGNKTKSVSKLITDY